MSATERERRVTELGVEVRCARCREFWPEDKQFFFMSGGKSHSWCKACYRSDEKIVAKDARWRARQRKGDGPARQPQPAIEWQPLLQVLQPHIGRPDLDTSTRARHQAGMFSGLIT